MMQLLAHPTDAYPEKKCLVSRIVDYSGTDYFPSHVVLNGGDYSNNPAVLDEFRDIAFYWNRSKPKDGVPAHVRSLMDDASCTHLIWLSQRALEEEEVLFVIIFAHELRHLYQATHGFSRDRLRQIVRDLRRRPEFSRLPSGPLGVDELDSDLFAMQIAKKLLGADQVEAFLLRRRLPRCPFPEYVKFLDAIESAREPVQGD